MFLYLVVIIVFFPFPAHAYIDLGTGSMIFQALVAGFLGAVFTIKMFWYNITHKIKKLLGKEDKSSPPEPPEKSHDSSED